MERKKYIDALRALAVIGVIIIHVACNNWYGYVGSWDWIAFTIYCGVARVAVPIFFMISGVLFLSDDKELSVSYMMKHALKLLFVLVGSAVVYQFANRQFNMKEIFHEILLTKTQSHLWFLYSIIGIYIVTPILKHVVKSISINEFTYMLILCLLVGCLIPTLNSFVYSNALNNWFNKVNQISCSGYVGYFLLGHFLDKYEIKEKKNRVLIYVLGLVGTLVTVIGVIIDCMTTDSLQERFFGYCTPWVAMTSIALFIYIKSRDWSKQGYKILFSVSKYSLEIYVVHFLVIMFLWSKGITTFLFSGFISVPVISIIVLISSLLIAYIMQACGRIRYK